MFEKEAEKHCNETLCSVCENPTCTEHVKCREWRDRRAGFYCGAEFGFQKGIKARINTTTISDCPIKDEYAKAIIQDLLNNSDEYARQRAIDYLKEE